MDDRIARRRHNVMVDRRINGLPAQATPEGSDDDPTNPNVPPRLELTPEDLEGLPPELLAELRWPGKPRKPR